MGTGLPDFFSRTWSTLTMKFIDLQDAPISYLAAANKNVRVNITETEVEFGGAYLEYGLASAIGAAGRIGRMYWATDTKILYRDDGVDWIEILRGEAVSRLASLSEKAHASLTGVSADQHHAKAHQADHKEGAADPLTVDLNSNARLGVKAEGVSKGVRRGLNFIAGDNITIGVADDDPNEDVDVTLTPSVGSGHITIMPFSYKVLPQGNAAALADNSEYMGGVIYNPSSSDGDCIDYAIHLAKGTYSWVIHFQKDVNRGIIKMSIGGKDYYTGDWYNSSTLRWQFSYASGIVIPSSGLYILRIRVSGKNANSSGYIWSFGYQGLWRTA